MSPLDCHPARSVKSRRGCEPESLLKIYFQRWSEASAARYLLLARPDRKRVSTRPGPFSFFLRQSPVIRFLENPATRYRAELMAHARQTARPAKSLYRLLTRDRIDWIAVQETILKLVIETQRLSQVVDLAMQEVVE